MGGPQYATYVLRLPEGLTDSLIGGGALAVSYEGVRPSSGSQPGSPAHKSDSKWLPSPTTGTGRTPRASKDEAMLRMAKQVRTYPHPLPLNAFGFEEGRIGWIPASHSGMNAFAVIFGCQAGKPNHREREWVAEEVSGLRVSVPRVSD